MYSFKKYSRIEKRVKELFTKKKNMSNIESLIFKKNYQYH